MDSVMASPRRRFLIAVIAVALSVVAFHSSIATALVTRGDEALARGDVPGARDYYDRSLQWDPAQADAADRLVFYSSLSRDRNVARRGIDVATDYLRLRTSARIYRDRALCYLRLGERDRAVRDFTTAGSIDKSARDFTFAGWAALRAGRRQEARTLWRRALREDRHFEPALGALRKEFG